MSTATHANTASFAPHQSADIVAHYHEHGFVVVRAVIPRDEITAIHAEAERIRAQALAHGASFQAGNFCTVLDKNFDGGVDDGVEGGTVRAALWPALISARCDALRTDPRLLALVKPLIGDTLRSLTSQIHWKPPGSKVGVNFHTDRANRTPRADYRDLGSSFVQTGLAIDAMMADNGPLLVVPGSHRRERVLIEEQGNYGRGDASRDFLARAGCGPDAVLPLLAEPGDLVMWHPDIIHGSDLNRHPSSDRCLFINGYIDARATWRGYWAWIGGTAVPAPGPWCPVPLRDDAQEAFAKTAAALRGNDFWSLAASGGRLAVAPSAAD